MYFIETRQLGLEPESARKDKQTSNKISNKLPVRSLNKLLKTQAGDFSPAIFKSGNGKCGNGNGNGERGTGNL